jgi:hypothetical protein
LQLIHINNHKQQHLLFNMSQCSATAAAARQPSTDLTFRFIHRCHNKEGYMSVFYFATTVAGKNGGCTVQEVVKAGMRAVHRKHNYHHDDCKLVFATIKDVGRIVSPARELTREDLKRDKPVFILWEGSSPPGYTIQSALMAETAATATLTTQKSIRDGVQAITSAIAALGHRISLQRPLRPGPELGLGPEPTCSICLDSPPTMKAMPCGHTAFCVACVAGMQEAKMATCPMCRTPLTGFE